MSFSPLGSDSIHIFMIYFTFSPFCVSRDEEICMYVAFVASDEPNLFFFLYFSHGKLTF